jgi:hypothetical protein
MPTTTKLTASQAKALDRAETRVATAKAELEDAEAERQTLRDRYHDLVPLSDDAEEAAKGIRVAAAGGITVRIAPMVSGETFRYRDYKLAGHPVTPEMAEFLKDGKPYDRWTVRAPRKTADAVEPRQL